MQSARVSAWQVRANRTVLQAGDPIALTVRLNGDPAILDTITFPQLDAAGLDANAFRFPSGDASGNVQGNIKTFEFVGARRGCKP